MFAAGRDEPDTCRQHKRSGPNRASPCSSARALSRDRNDGSMDTSEACRVVRLNARTGSALSGGAKSPDLNFALPACFLGHDLAVNRHDVRLRSSATKQTWSRHSDLDLVVTDASPPGVFRLQVPMRGWPIRALQRNALVADDKSSAARHRASTECRMSPVDRERDLHRARLPGSEYARTSAMPDVRAAGSARMRSPVALSVIDSMSGF